MYLLTSTFFYRSSFLLYSKDHSTKKEFGVAPFMGGVVLHCGLTLAMVLYAFPVAVVARSMSVVWSCCVVIVVMFVVPHTDRPYYSYHQYHY